MEESAFNKDVKVILSFLKNNIEGMIGVFFLIPPFISVINFILGFFTDFGFEYYYDDDFINGMWWGDVASMPIYMGLMAIAGAYLIKGNLNKKKD